MPANRERPRCPEGRQADLFEDMAEQLYVDLGEAAKRENGEAIARARARCLNCDAADECKGWLDASFGVIYW